MFGFKRWTRSKNEKSGLVIHLCQLSTNQNRVSHKCHGQKMVHGVLGGLTIARVMNPPSNCWLPSSYNVVTQFGSKVGL